MVAEKGMMPSSSMGLARGDAHIRWRSVSVSELLGKALGQYQVVELIGQGGMARVYKAYHAALDRYVAIKVIPTRTESAQEQDFLQRFTNEARLIAKLAHPHIVPIHDFGEDAGWAYIVMEFISSGTIRERLMQAEATRMRLNLQWVLKVIEQAAEALDFAHASGIVHRDVKPGNMLLRSEDYLLLSDFGIATILAARRATSLAGGGSVGTPQYMAPEQAVPGGVVDGRADIYSLGVVFFQCVAGQLPFMADTPMALVMKHANQPPPRPTALVPGLPVNIERIILKAMAKDPTQRYPRAAAMAADLRIARSELPANPRGAMPTLPPNPAITGAYGLYPAVQPPMGTPGAPGTCFRCGAANNPQHHFCTSCGYDLSGRRAAVDQYRLPDGRILRCRLIFRNGPLLGRVYLLHQDTTTLGRTTGNDVLIPDGTVSRRHACLSFAGGAWYVEDVGSSNGTWVNGARVQRPTRLEHGDEVRLGDEVLTFELIA
jgi:serine/threonine protein kinase